MKVGAFLLTFLTSWKSVCEARRLESIVNSHFGRLSPRFWVRPWLMKWSRSLLLVSEEDKGAWGRKYLPLAVTQDFVLLFLLFPRHFCQLLPQTTSPLCSSCIDERGILGSILLLTLPQHRVNHKIDRQKTWTHQVKPIRVSYSELDLLKTCTIILSGII